MNSRDLSVVVYQYPWTRSDTDMELFYLFKSCDSSDSWTCDYTELQCTLCTTIYETEAVYQYHTRCYSCEDCRNCWKQVTVRADDRLYEFQTNCPKQRGCLWPFFVFRKLITLRYKFTLTNEQRPPLPGWTMVSLYAIHFTATSATDRTGLLHEMVVRWSWYYNL